MTKHPVIIEDTGLGLFQVEVRAQGASFLSDEPISSGGLASGPGPFDLLGAALGACTVMTVKLYAQRKSIAVSHVQVMVTHQRDPESRRDVFERSIFIDATVTGEEMKLLLAAADRCPVSRTLSAGSDIVTTRSETAIATARRVEDKTHIRAMDRVCDELADG
ncbi:OsmC family protein [Frateuria hangzhouensis]|uniref:OsmC family protein n=1 Tax=Frateuria hangzhouensis TaxID=2995589 RepID=UPI002260901A|nr:OsmC family protein [Frateuria sp. STR12]MCX7513086.1 OsmC family protein [Frateuria sp. STR12]